VAEQRAAAIEFASESYLNVDHYYFDGGPEDGTIGNALQHADFALRLALKYDEELAREVLERHELITGPNSRLERVKRQQDWANNEYGLMLAQAVGRMLPDFDSQTELGERVLLHMATTYELCVLTGSGEDLTYDTRTRDRCGA
jgi:hypothetical protein